MADSGDLREQIVGTSPNEITVINYNIASRSLPFDYIGLCHPLSQKMCNMENQLYRGQGITSGPIYKHVTRDYDATSLQKYVYIWLVYKAIVGLYCHSQCYCPCTQQNTEDIEKLAFFLALRFRFRTKFGYPNPLNCNSSTPLSNSL